MTRVFAAALSLVGTLSLADTAPDATGANPATSVTSAEYRFTAEIDPDVTSDRFTEKWARVYWPDHCRELRCRCSFFCMAIITPAAMAPIRELMTTASTQRREPAL
jgi:hypothetical protein